MGNAPAFSIRNLLLVDSAKAVHLAAIHMLNTVLCSYACENSYNTEGIQSFQ